MDFIAV
jgi:hypothetical protein